MGRLRRGNSLRTGGGAIVLGHGQLPTSSGCRVCPALFKPGRLKLSPQLKAADPIEWLHQQQAGDIAADMRLPSDQLDARTGAKPGETRTYDYRNSNTRPQ